MRNTEQNGPKEDGMNIAEKTVLAQTPAMRGEKVYEQELDITGITA
jgi:hypothetical protein